MAWISPAAVLAHPPERQADTLGENRKGVDQPSTSDDSQDGSLAWSWLYECEQDSNCSVLGEPALIGVKPNDSATDYSAYLIRYLAGDDGDLAALAERERVLACLDHGRCVDGQFRFAFIGPPPSPDRQTGGLKYFVSANAPQQASTTQPSDDNAPFLPWPPPRPTSMIKIGWDMTGIADFRTIALQLEEQLRASGYEKLRYFSVPSGFGVITQVERMPVDGRAVPAKQRFKVGKLGARNILDYLEMLLSGEAGRYYLGAIIVSNEEFEPSQFGLADKEVRDLLARGSFSLSKQRSAMPVGPGTRVTLLNYEFDTAPARERTLLIRMEGERAQLHADRLNLSP